jgi:hypothetical protein
MALPITIPYTFANATTTQNLSYLDSNFNALVNGLNGLANGTSQISISSISATGNANATTYLRGDGSWSVVSGGGGSGTVTSVNANSTVSGFTFTGGPVTTSGTLTLTGPSPGASGNVLTSNGSSWTSSAGAYPLTSGTAVASTSGTSIDFTGIPSWAKRVTVMFNGVSTNGTNGIILQIGSGSVDTTGYIGGSIEAASGSAGSIAAATTLFYLASMPTSSAIISGVAVIALLGSNSWTMSSNMSNSQGQRSYSSSGAKTLSGVLDRVRITTVGGTDTFDAGSINILYE